MPHRAASIWFLAALLVVGGGAAHPCRAAAADGVRDLRTASGVEFTVLGDWPAAPAPTLFVFAHERRATLESDDYNRAGKLLRAQGWMCVALDVPCHGTDRRAGEPEGLTGWRHRLDQGEDPIAPFCRRASAVLEELIADDRTDPRRVAACGTSRGGFAALHFAASEPRIRCVAGFAPVTDLKILSEFADMSPDQAARDLLLARQAERLSDRPVWIIIGPHDERVGTDSAIGLARQIAAAAVARQRPPLAEIHVEPSEGHRLPARSHESAAAWFLRALAP